MEESAARPFEMTVWWTDRPAEGPGRVGITTAKIKVELTEDRLTSQRRDGRS
jgi:hypothetical protein